ncbi:MAG: winged helix-turn-helix domain-containing protein [Candidatus Brocadia sp.]|nr:MAG: winged helix-turn-helix domain-containing protein [Candidatus Brocadia sp.]
MSLVKSGTEHEPCRYGQGCRVEPEHGQNYSEPLSPKVLLGKGRGGKRYSNLTINQEKELLDSFFEKAKSGGVLVVSEIKIAYEKLFNKKVPKSTIYRMLARHGWPKIAPRSKHLRTDFAVQEEF